MAADKSTALDLGAAVCFEDGTGQGMRPPKGRTGARRGQRPTVRVRGSSRGRVSLAGVRCCRPGHRPRMFFRPHVHHGRHREPKTFTWREYRDLIVDTHQQLGTPLVWVWDNLNVHLQQEWFDFAAGHQDWLRIFHLPSYAPELNPVEHLWSLLKRHLADFAAADLAHLTRAIKRKLKKIQYRPHLIEGCLAGTGLIIEPPTDTTSST
ncbi:hypothetical protein GCM10010389_48190 [Streptomyces echinoruber]|uniref:Tc1-like transposase DDE domain-containing protein n=2 Tax=Streptomyces echinoruber TaxID=68898 RepID=A0A918VI33_9ACTN|nr:hypothetical protein GCM10010389_48190 [Streptomyces echinoruber]